MAEENEDENKDQGVEEEMLRMMEQELGIGADQEPETDGDEDKSESDFEAEMLKAMQDEGSGGAAQATEGAESDLEAEMLQAMMAETSAETPEEAQTALQKAQHMLSGTEINTQNVHRLMGIHLSIIIELGRTEVAISSLLEWSEGSLIELDRVSGDAVDIYVSGKPFARGEVVTIAENFGVRLTEILPYIPDIE